MYIKKGEGSLSVDTHIHTNTLERDNDKDVCGERKKLSFNIYLTYLLNFFFMFPLSFGSIRKYKYI